PTNQRGATAEFSPDQRHVLTETRWPTEIQTMFLWDITQRSSPRKLWEKTGGLLGVTAFSADGRKILAAIRDEKKSLALLDTQSGEEIATLRHEEPGGVIQGIAFAPDGRFAASTRLGDSTIHIWALE